MPNPLHPGLTAELHRTVEEKDTATHIGNVQVLASPVMIGLMEYAAAAAVEPALAEGTQTVGIHVDVKHIAATPVGMKVTAHAELTKVDGRILTFRVWADDEKERIGEGTHQRAIIDVAKFRQKVQAKRSG
jgi:fluoroacetyl-CoA thioesterase